jgi:4'-phosphopantetheinyl transferase
MPISPAVDIAIARLDPPPERVRAVSGALSAEEQGRAARFHFERDRRRFIVARARLRALLAARLGTAPGLIEFGYGAHGKPALAGRFATSGWRFNLSRRGELALFAFCRSGEVGIDVEALDRLPEADELAARAFSAEEKRSYLGLSADERALGFFRCWTRKEALAKALGVGLAAEGSGLEAGPPPGWRLHSFSPLTGFIAALAHRC